MTSAIGDSGGVDFSRIKNCSTEDKEKDFSAGKCVTKLWSKNREFSKGGEKTPK